LRGHPRTVNFVISSLKIILDMNPLFLLSNIILIGSVHCIAVAISTMSPPPPTNQLVTLFSPTPNDPHSGRTTPSSVGGASSGRASAFTVDSSGSILFDI
jgi:hypothetical protein